MSSNWELSTPPIKCFNKFENLPRGYFCVYFLDPMSARVGYYGLYGFLFLWVFFWFRKNRKMTRLLLEMRWKTVRNWRHERKRCEFVKNVFWVNLVFNLLANFHVQWAPGWTQINYQLFLTIDIHCMPHTVLNK